MTQNLKKTKFLFILTALLIVAVAFIPTLAVANADNFTDDDIASTVRGRGLWYLNESFYDLGAAKTFLQGIALNEQEPIFIGVIDTGINYNHELFSKTLLWVEDEGERKPVGYNSGNADTPNNISDGSSEYHGTHVAGIISLMILELGLENCVKIIPIKAINSSNQFTSTAVANAIRWACGENTLENTLGYKMKCSVINMSLSILNSKISTGSWSNLTALQSAINDYDEQAVFVAAAGNDSKDTADDYAFPAYLDEVVSVMNYKQNDQAIALYSNTNYGEYDLAAPGTGIYSATGSGTTVYDYKTGTSMASPFVSFAAALLKLRYPTVTASKLTKFLRGHESGISTTKNAYYIKGVDIKSLLTTDFLSDAAYDYVAPTKVIVECLSTNLNQTMANREAINFNATIAPLDSHNPALDKEITWVVEREGTGKQKFKEGNDFSFDNRFTGGKYKIYAVLNFNGETLTSNETQIEIEFAPFDFEKICIAPIEWIDNYEGDGSDVPCYLGTTLTLSFTDIEYCDQTLEYKWFVDGELVHKGVTFDYQPTTMGKHTIAAKIDGYPLKEFTINVKAPYAIGYSIAILTILLFGGIIAKIIADLKRRPYYEIIEDVPYEIDCSADILSESSEANVDTEKVDVNLNVNEDNINSETNGEADEQNAISDEEKN